MITKVEINRRVDVLVTNNLKHFREAAMRFNIAVLTPGSLLKRIAVESV